MADQTKIHTAGRILAASFPAGPQMRGQPRVVIQPDLLLRPRVVIDFDVADGAVKIVSGVSSPAKSPAPI